MDVRRFLEHYDLGRVKGLKPLSGGMFMRPVRVDSEIHLEVTDDVVSENDGRFVLQISGGEATVAPGGEGRLKLDVGTLAPLFTGLHSATTLASLGRLEGDAATIESADEAFAGPEPVMVERF